MASGSFAVSTSNQYISGKVSWSSTTDTANNRSNVTATMILERTNTGYTTWGTGTFNVVINGTTHSSGSKSFSLTYDSNTVMVSGSNYVTHNSDGSKSITISWSGSSDVFTVNSGSGTATLDKIPRESTLSSSANWTAGDSLAVTISRADSSFTHTVEVWVKDSGGTYQFITSEGGVGTSYTFSFTTSEYTELFQCLSQADSRGSLIRVYTYQNGTKIGNYKDKTGTLSNRSASTISMGDFNIGTNPSFSISRAWSGFTHTVSLTFGTYNPTDMTGVGTSGTYSLSASSMYQQTPSSNSKQGSVTCTTYYNGVQIRPSTSDTFYANVTNSNPTFASSQISYADTNTTITAITGNNQYIVQNKSTVRGTVSTSATGVNYATISKYEITINGIMKSLTSTGYQDFGTLNLTSNTSMTVKVIDSRGNSTTVSKTIYIVPYSSPVITTSATRLNGYEDSTTLKLSGSASSLSVAGVTKNAIVSAKYQYRQKGATTYSTAVSFTVSGFPSYTATDASISISKDYSYEVLFTVQDKIGTYTVTKVVSAGQPVFFINSVKKSIGVNKFPVGSSALETVGTISSANPNNIDASVSLSWSNDIARIRYGGSGVGAGNGFHIAGTGDDIKFSFDDDGNVSTKGNITVGGRYFNMPFGTAIESYDEWLRLNPSNSHSSGIYCASSVLRTDGSLQVGASGSVFNAHSSGLTHNGRNVEVINSEGSNANGNYIRYESGLQICWLGQSLASPTTFTSSVSHPNGGYYMYISGTWTYPQAFNVAPVMFCTGDFGGVYTEHHSGWTASTTAGSYENGIYWSAGVDTTTRPSLNRRLLAIGTWK